MPVISASKIELISQAIDKKAAIIKAVGDISKLKLTGALVLLGTYIRDEKTTGGIIRPKEVLQEDEYQGKVGLVLAYGPHVANWLKEDGADDLAPARLHSWVVYQIKDAWPFQLNGTACRMIDYEKIRAVIPDPSMVF